MKTFISLLVATGSFSSLLSAQTFVANYWADILDGPIPASHAGADTSLLLDRSGTTFWSEVMDGGGESLNFRWSQPILGGVPVDARLQVFVAPNIFPNMASGSLQVELLLADGSYTSPVTLNPGGGGGAAVFDGAIIVPAFVNLSLSDLYGGPLNIEGTRLSNWMAYDPDPGINTPIFSPAAVRADNVYIVPEPSTAILGSVGILLGLHRRRPS